MKDIWKGQTVAIFATGPGMSPEAAQSAIDAGYRTIAVSSAIQHAPNADVFVALDPAHPLQHLIDQFQGIKIYGVPVEGAKYLGMFYEKVSVGPNEMIEIRNNGLAALRIAELAGAAKVVLVGFDAARYDSVHAHTGFRGFAQGFEQLTSELRGKGIEVEIREADVPVAARRQK